VREEFKVDNLEPEQAALVAPYMVVADHLERMIQSEPHRVAALSLLKLSRDVVLRSHLPLESWATWDDDPDSSTGLDPEPAPDVHIDAAVPGFPGVGR